MSTKKTLDNQLHTYQLSNDCYTFSEDVCNWKSVSYIHTKKKERCLDEIQCYLRKYFSNHMSMLHQRCQMKDFIDKQTFEQIIRNSGLSIEKVALESLWNSCQPSEKGVRREVFCEHFAPFELENNQNPKPPNQCQKHNYKTLIDHTVKHHWQNLKEDFASLDRYGRLIITVDQAINLMKKYCFSLNNKQQCELALLFSPKNNGQFLYFDFMQSFIDQSSAKNLDQGIFSRSTYSIQSKQSWSNSSITIVDILHQIRSQCILKYESIHRMFQKIDRHRQGYLTKNQFNQLLKQFNIHLDENEFYHLMSEIDKNQDGILTYDEIYYSLITDLLQI